MLLFSIYVCVYFNVSENDYYESKSRFYQPLNFFLSKKDKQYKKIIRRNISNNSNRCIWVVEKEIK
jgi:hypothetical protein